jgi:hypothetical protein
MKSSSSDTENSSGVSIPSELLSSSGRCRSASLDFLSRSVPFVDDWRV